MDTHAVSEREGALREEVHEELRRVLDLETLSEPGLEESGEVRRLVRRLVDAANHRAASAGGPLLPDPDGLSAAGG